MPEPGASANTPRLTELWRVERRRDAYTDQTGLTHAGQVVLEQIIVSETGYFDQWEGYAGRKYDSGRVCEAVDGRVFLRRQNLVDYCGGSGWRLVFHPGWAAAEAWNLDVSQPGHWEQAPRSVAGYCYPDGSGPVAKTATETLAST